MEYTDFAYLYPPRPEVKIPKDMIGFYEKRGWIAQKKKNGTCTVIFARGDEVIFKTRHPDDMDGNHKQWKPLPEHIAFFSSNSDKWNVYVAELLHNKTQHIKNELYIFDQLVKDGVQLVGVTQEERHEMLVSAWEIESEEDDLYRINQHITVAKNIESGFKKLYDTLKPEDEGLVFKNPTAKLKPCFRQTANDSWQVKCRIPHKNYGF